MVPPKRTNWSPLRIINVSISMVLLSIRMRATRSLCHSPRPRFTLLGSRSISTEAGPLINALKFTVPLAACSSLAQSAARLTSSW